MTENQNETRYDLKERTFKFAQRVRSFTRQLSKTLGNNEDAKQLLRASGSVGANYIEANEALSKKDFLMRIKICRKEAKESMDWLRLVDVLGSVQLINEQAALLGEAKELMMIFGSIVRKS